MKRRTVNVGDLTISYLEAGEGPTLVLLHGGGLDSAAVSWEHLMPDLADAGVRVIAPDLPGAGQSSCPDVDYTLEFYAAVVADLLVALELGPVTLGGISLGGGVSLRVALDRPELLERLILVDSYGISDHVPGGRAGYWIVHTPGLAAATAWLTARSRWFARYGLKAIFHDPAMITDAVLERVMHAARRTPAMRTFNSFQRSEVTRRGLRSVFTDRLGDIKLPTLVIHGTEDQLVPIAASRQAAERIPNGRLAVIEAAGHWPNGEQPMAFVRAVLEFVLRLQAPFTRPS